MSIIPDELKQPEASQSPPPPEPEGQGNPIVAALISLVLPGMGHFYAGKRFRGVLYLILMVVLGVLLWWVGVTKEFEPFTGMQLVLGVFLGLLYLWLIASAYRVSSNATFAPVVGMALVLAFVYLVGWQATEVNLHKFFTEFSDTGRIFTRILWPWGAAVERDIEYDVARADWFNPCEEGSIPDVLEPADQGEWISITPTCGDFSEYRVGEDAGVVPGTDIAIRGGGWTPGETLQLWWVDPLGEKFRPLDSGERLTVQPDENGEFEFLFTAPQYFTPSVAVGVQDHQIEIRQVASISAPHLSENFRLAVERLTITIFQALMATSLGIVFALPLSFLAARNLMYDNPVTRVIYFIVRFLMNVARSIEPLIWAVIAVVWVGLGPFAGVLALMIHTIAALGKLYSESIESIDPGPIEAITATGANRLQVIMYAIVPQIVPPFLSFTLYRWDINVRMSTIIGFVGGGGIGQILFQWINQSLWSSAGMAVWLIALTVSLMDFASSELRKRFV